MADRERRSTKRLSLEESMARLQKYARLGKGKGKGVAQPSGAAAPPVAPSRATVPSAVQSSRAAVHHEAPREDRPREDRPRVDRPREDRARVDKSREKRPREERPREDRPAGRHDARSSRPRDEPSSPESSIHRVMVTKFAEQLSVEVAESSRRTDHIEAIADSTACLIGSLCVLFSRSAAVRVHANRTADELKVAEADIRALRKSEKEVKAAAEGAKKVAKEAKKVAEETAKAAKESVMSAEDKMRRAEDWAASAKRKAEEAETSRLEMEAALKKAKEELAAARAEHQRYFDVALPATLEDARTSALAEYLESKDFRARLVSEYQDGMRDMKAGFIASNPSLVGVNWSFVPD